MSFKEWLYAELQNDEVIDPDEVDLEELSEDMLLAETEVTEDDLENYKNQFREHCESTGDTPDWDLD